MLPSKIREYGRAHLISIEKNELFENIPLNSTVWMSHGDTIAKIPEKFQIIAQTSDVKVAAFKIADELTYGIQFHPEVTHSSDGKALIKISSSTFVNVNRIGHLRHLFLKQLKT